MVSNENDKSSNDPLKIRVEATPESRQNFARKRHAIRSPPNISNRSQCIFRYQCVDDDATTNTFRKNEDSIVGNFGDRVLGRYHISVTQSLEENEMSRQQNLNKDDEAQLLTDNDKLGFGFNIKRARSDNLSLDRNSVFIQTNDYQKNTRRVSGALPIHAQSAEDVSTRGLYLCTGDCGEGRNLAMSLDEDFLSERNTLIENQELISDAAHILDKVVGEERNGKNHATQNYHVRECAQNEVAPSSVVPVCSYLNSNIGTISSDTFESSTKQFYECTTSTRKEKKIVKCSISSIQKVSKLDSGMKLVTNKSQADDSINAKVGLNDFGNLNRSNIITGKGDNFDYQSSTSEALMFALVPKEQKLRPENPLKSRSTGILDTATTTTSKISIPKIIYPRAKQVSQSSSTTLGNAGGVFNSCDCSNMQGKRTQKHSRQSIGQTFANEESVNLQSISHDSDPSMVVARPFHHGDDDEAHGAATASSNLSNLRCGSSDDGRNRIWNIDASRCVKVEPFDKRSHLFSLSIEQRTSKNRRISARSDFKGGRIQTTKGKKNSSPFTPSIERLRRRSLGNGKNMSFDMAECADKERPNCISTPKILRGLSKLESKSPFIKSKGLMKELDKDRKKNIKSSNRETATPSPPCTPFRFSTFPDSLPRVNPGTSQNIEDMQRLFAIAPGTPLQPRMDVVPDETGTPKTFSFGAAKSPLPITTTFFPHDRQKRNQNEFHEEGNDVNKLNISRDSNSTSMSSISMDNKTNNTFETITCQKKHSGRNIKPRPVWMSPLLDESLSKSEECENASPRIVKSFLDRNSNTFDWESGDDQNVCHDKEQFWLKPQHLVATTSSDTEGEGRMEINSPLNEMESKIIGSTRLNFNSIFSPGPAKTKSKYTAGHDYLHEDDRVKEGRNVSIEFSHDKTLDRNTSQSITQEYIKTSSSDLSQISCPNFSHLKELDDHTSDDNRVTRLSTRNANQIDEKTTCNDSLTISSQEANFRVYLESAKCSPIASIPGEDEYNDCGGRRSSESGKLTILRTNSSNGMRSQAKTSSQNDQMAAEMLDVDSLHQSSGILGHSMSSGLSGKSRNNRPRPDMSAFELEHSITSTSIQANDLLQNGESNSSLGGYSPEKLLCPPTPVRTPAWAHNASIAPRTDSLIATKILAACPPQVLDNLSSLENSLMDDEKNDSEHDHFSNSLSVSFSAVMEEDEGDNKEGCPKVNLSNEISQKSVQNDYSSENKKQSLQNVESSRMSISSDISKTTNTSIDKSSVLQNNFSKIKHSRHSSGPTSARISLASGEVGTSMSFETDFENLGQLGSGAFADVLKVRSKQDNHLYAIKRGRRQFRGKRDRDRAMAEVRIMQRLHSVVPSALESRCLSNKDSGKSSFCIYILSFICAWQEDGYFFCQTELCCRDTCLHMMLSLTSNWSLTRKIYPSLEQHLVLNSAKNANDTETNNDWHLVPESTIWKICHNVAAGLCHIHSHGIVHYDIKPINILFVPHPRLGALCKIGDFGMAGDIDTVEDGQEGDTRYMPRELLSSGKKHPSADIFSLGLSIYELASDGKWKLPAEGSRWHCIRDESHIPELPSCRNKVLLDLIKRMISSDVSKRPTADEILKHNNRIIEAGTKNDPFLTTYVRDADDYGLEEERARVHFENQEKQIRYTPTSFEREKKFMNSS